MNAVLSVPPRRLAASLVSRNGARTTSKWRRSERSVHSGEWAFSTSDSCDRTPRTVSTVAALAAGIAVGSMSSSCTWRATPSGSRKPPAIRSRIDSAAVGLGGGGVMSAASSSIGGGGGASRSKSRNCSDICTPPSPSVIVWCIFCTSAALPPRRPSMTVNCHSGRIRSKRVVDEQRGEVEQLAHRARLGQRDAADVVVDVEVGVVDPRRRRQVHRGRLDPPPQPRHGPRRPLHPGPQGVEVRRAVEHRDGAERRGEVRDPCRPATSGPRRPTSCGRRSPLDDRTPDAGAAAARSAPRQVPPIERVAPRPSTAPAAPA